MTPNNDEVICPNCAHQFRAIPQNVQQLMLDVGFKPPFTTPPQRTWVGLTQDELNMIGDSMRTWNSWTITDVYFAIEAKLKEKNT